MATSTAVIVLGKLTRCNGPRALDGYGHEQQAGQRTGQPGHRDPEVSPIAWQVTHCPGLPDSLREIARQHVLGHVRTPYLGDV